MTNHPYFRKIQVGKFVSCCYDSSCDYHGAVSNLGHGGELFLEKTYLIFLKGQEFRNVCGIFWANIYQLMDIASIP